MSYNVYLQTSQKQLLRNERKTGDRTLNQGLKCLGLGRGCSMGKKMYLKEIKVYT